MDWLGDDDQLNKNALLFIFVRENSDADVKIKNVTRCLDQGADVNAADGNDGGNTSLHVAARRAEAALVSMLLDRGADVTQINNNKKTSIEIARAYHTQYNDIVTLLKNAQTSGSVDRKRTLNTAIRETINYDPSGTALHEVVRRGDVPAIILLLNSGADVTRKNWNGFTPLDIATELYTEYKHVVELLETTKKSTKYNNINNNNNDQCNNGDKSQPYGNIFQNSCQPTFANKVKQNDEQTDFTYDKRGGTSGAKGFLYEIKLLSLILIRVLNDNQIQNFLIGTNLDGIGALDDICLWCQVKDQKRPFRLFVQTKHREDPEKNKLTVKDVKSPHGDFSLQKYFKSYIMIRDKFLIKDEDPMFKGDFSNGNLVLYTSACVCNCFENQDKKKIELNAYQRIHNLIYTNPKINPFQYKYDESEIELLAKNIVMDQLREFGVIFFGMVLSQKTKKEEYDMMLFNKLIAKYHVIIGRDVLQQQEMRKIYREWKFRPEFFETKCEYLAILKSTLINEMSTTLYDRSKVTDEDRKNLMEVFQYPSALTVSRVLGKLATYSEDTKTLQLIEDTAFKAKFDSDEFKELLEYFKRLTFNANIIYQAVQIKLTSLTIQLPLAFGNLDMTFRGSKTKVQKRMKAVAKKIIELLDSNKNSGIININDEVVGPEKIIPKGIIGIDGGIGGAVGNLLKLDSDTNALKFDLDNETLPENAALFLQELKNAIQIQPHENLSRCRINVNINRFPVYSFNDNSYKTNARDYLHKLLFYANQAQEDKVEDIVESHIDEYYHGTDSFTIPADSILLRVHDELMKWSFQSGKVRYLSGARDPFKSARVEIINDLFKCVFSKILKN